MTGVQTCALPIYAGLEDGDRVIVAGVQKVQPGAVVQTVESQTATTAATPSVPIPTKATAAATPSAPKTVAAAGEAAQPPPGTPAAQAK